jgi:hypothetical protein
MGISAIIVGYCRIFFPQEDHISCHTSPGPNPSNPVLPTHAQNCPPSPRDALASKVQGAFSSLTAPTQGWAPPILLGELPHLPLHPKEPMC